MFNLGIFKVELANLSYLMPTPSNFPKSNVSSRNKNPYFTTKIALLGVFLGKSFKSLSFEINSLDFVKMQASCKIKILNQICLI